MTLHDAREPDRVAKGMPSGKSLRTVVTLTPDQHQEISSRAREAGMPFAGMARVMIQRGLKASKAGATT